jgi:Ca2+-binding EF-hand superfamily protein
MTISKGERTVEKQRQALASIQAFEPHQCFMRIDRDGDNKITSREILNFLRSNNVDEATEADASQIVQYFAANAQAEHLVYEDLLQLMMPCDDSDLRADMC